MNTQEIVKVAANEAELLKFVKGPWQRECICGNQITFPQLRGKAADYRSSYERSMRGLLARIEGAGYEIEPVPGPRGGRPKMWRVYRQRGQ